MEIVQFANAELVGGRTWRLSRLLRGQAGSEYAMSASLAAGAAFVMLSRQLVPVARGRNALERPMQLRIAAAGLSHADPSAVALTVTPRAAALMPLSPVHLHATRKADGVHLSWIRRTRIDGDGWSGEVPLGEEGDAYVLDILSASSVVRSNTCVSAQAFYSNADELADFGTVQASLTVRVAQLSSSVGAGHAVQEVLTV